MSVILCQTLPSFKDLMGTSSGPTPYLWAPLCCLNQDFTLTVDCEYHNIGIHHNTPEDGKPKECLQKWEVGGEKYQYCRERLINFNTANTEIHYVVCCW